MRTARKGHVVLESHILTTGLLMALFAGETAWANLIFAGPPPLAAYLSSEKLLVSISATDAVVNGSFTFETQEHLRPPSDTDQWHGERFMSVDLYIWFPERNDDPTVGAFWNTFRKSNINLLTTNATANTVFDDAVGLRIKIGDHALSAGSGIDWFLPVPYRPPNPKTERLLSELMKAMHVPKGPPLQLDEPGFCQLLLGFHDDGSIVRNRTVVEISYRQPLVSSGGEGRFYYMPVFVNTPEGFSTADTNRYSITFVAKDCTLAITNGTQFGKVENGSSVIFAPQLYQPFRATSRSKPKPGS